MHSGFALSKSGEQCALGGLVVRREAWRLSWRGRFVVSIALAAAFLGFLFGAYPFLTVNNGGRGEVLVVEGWIGGRRVDEAAAAFTRGNYKCVVVVRDLYKGGDKWSSGRYTSDYVAADLVELGVPKESVHLLFCPVVRKDRTYHCALAVREWLDQNGLVIASLDVATLATHSRRSRLLYEKAFGPGVSIGAIAIEDPSYDPARWWASSAGVRDVLSEAIAYVYARVFF